VILKIYEKLKVKKLKIKLNKEKKIKKIMCDDSKGNTKCQSLQKNLFEKVYCKQWLLVAHIFLSSSSFLFLLFS